MLLDTGSSTILPIVENSEEIGEILATAGLMAPNLLKRSQPKQARYSGQRMRPTTANLLSSFACITLSRRSLAFAT